MEGSPLPSRCTSGAFARNPSREPFIVETVVIDHVILTDPVKPLFSCGIQFLEEPGAWGWSGARRCTRKPHTGIRLKVSVGGRERGLAPICLHCPASRGPVIRVPYAWLDPHWPGLRKRDSYWFHVLELSDGCPIYVEAESRTEGGEREAILGSVLQLC